MLGSKSPLTKYKPNDLVMWGLWLLVVVLLIRDHGLADGLRLSASTGYMIALLWFCLSVAMAFLLHQPIISMRNRLLIVVVLAYAAASLSFGWPGLAPLTFIGGVGGLFIGVVCAINSPDHRWR